MADTDVDVVTVEEDNNPIQEYLEKDFLEAVQKYIQEETKHSFNEIRSGIVSAFNKLGVKTNRHWCQHSGVRGPSKPHCATKKGRNGTVKTI